MRTLWLFFFFLVNTAHSEQPFYITFPSDIDWVTRSSHHFDILYRRGQDRFALRAITAAEKAYRLLNPIFPPGPERTWLVLADFHDAINGYAITFPWPHMVIFAAPPNGSDQLATLDDWLDSVILHENVHVRHLYPATGLWGTARSVFGSIMSPNAFMPSHFHEGLAVLMETELTGGGRGRGSYFSMIRRMAVEEKLWGKSFLRPDQMDGGLTTWPQGTSAYFFGYQLTKELWDRGGQKGIYDWVDQSSSNWPYLQDLPLKKVYHTDYSELWKSIFEKTNQKTSEEIKEIKASPLSELTYLTDSRYHKSQVTLSPDRKQIAYLRSLPEDNMKLEIVDMASRKEVRSFDFKYGGGEGFCWVQSKEREGLFVLEAVPRHRYQLNRLRFLDLRTGGKKDILIAEKDSASHLYRLSCDPRRMHFLLYRELAGEGKVQELTAEFKKGERDRLVPLREWLVPEKSWVTSLLAGTVSWVGLRIQSQTYLYRWEENDLPVEVAKVPTHLYGLRSFSEDRLLALARFDGRDEVWELDLKEKLRRKRVALLGGANAFDYNPDGRQFFLSSYRHGGYDLAQAAEVDFVPISLEESKDVPHKDNQGETLSESVSDQKEYSPVGTLLPHAWIPNILLVPNGLQAGVWIPGFDISQKHAYNFFGGYDTRGLPFADLSYSYRFDLEASLNSELYYLPNYIYSSRTFFTQWGASVGLANSFQWFPNLTVAGGLAFKRTEESVLGPSVQSVGFQVSASYKFGFNSRPVSVSPISGTKLSVSYQQFFKAMGSDEDYASTVFGWDQYWEAPWWREHAFALISRLGLTGGSPFFNNYFLSGGELLFAQYRGSFINRGFSPGTFIGRKLLNLNFEYRFPLARVERGIYLWPAKLQSVHMALVADFTSYDRHFGGPLDVGNDSNLFKLFYTSAGAELKTDWNFFFYVPTQLRFGIYHGFGPLGTPVYLNCGMETTL